MLTPPKSSVHMRQKPQKVSVILSTYNMPVWLTKSVWGFAHQTVLPFEVLIADDGSRDETKRTIDQLRRDTGLRIRHVWHEDDGFQKCRILNRAIEQANGDYLLFSDGDCVPRTDFLEQHVLAARPGHFLSGGYYKLPMGLSETITVDDIQSGRAFSVRWLRSNGLPFSHRLLRLSAGQRRAQILNALTTTRPTWNGHNASGWTSDVVRAGGFDERMRYGGEDRELGERLVNAGIRPIQIRFHAICLHLDHARGYVNEEDLENNRRIREETRRSGSTVTKHGLRKQEGAAEERAA
ncbi:MAG: glycosyltransferase family 2 protein [Planctomycetota bacterium]